MDFSLGTRVFSRQPGFMRMPMKTRLLIGFLTAVALQTARAQFVMDCSCFSTQAVLMTNACQAVVPDLCQFTNCYYSAIVPPVPLMCSQNPSAGTVVGPGTYGISVTVSDPNGTAQSCAVLFTVNPPAGGGQFSLICASNKTVECGTAWNFDPPTPTNYCCPHPGTPGNGVTITVVSTVTNGTCPQVITRTWQGVDDCGKSATCSQTVTVVDTTPPVLDCNCLQNPAVVQLTVTACSNAIPDLCLLAGSCATDNCGPLTCSQSPAAGTVVFPGTHPITVTIYDCASNSASCTVNFVVTAPPGGCNTNPCVPAPPGMMAWWPLDETAGATVYADFSGSGNTVVVESGGPLGNAGSPSPVAGKVAGASDFIGPGQRGRVPIPSALNVGNGSFTIDAWVKPKQPGGPSDWHCIVDKYDRSSSRGYTLAIQTGKLVLVAGDGTPQVFVSNNSLSFVLWTFVAVVVDRTANTVTFHFNGFSEPPQSLAPAGSFNSSVDLLIGNYYPSPNPQGLLTIDELEIFNRTLTLSEMNALWNADSFGKCKTNCIPQTRVWNTGMGGPSGNMALGAGTTDPNYTLASGPGGCAGPAQVLNAGSLPGQWVPNGPDSQWIGGGLLANCDPGVYHYRLCFYVPCTDGASIIGQWTADDWGEIFLNGQPTGHTVPSTQFSNNSFDRWHPVNLTNGFVCGTNCLDLYVTNASISINPTGLRAELTNVFNDCCCPPAQTIFSVFSGQNSAGPLTAGAPDTQFVLTCAPPGVSVTTSVVVYPHPLWIPNGPNSQWIGPNQFNNAPAGVYCYTFNFVIPCPPGTPIKASLTGRWSADDTGTIYLNGNPTGNTLPNGWAFLNWQAINITSGFVSGLNSLTFYVTNAGGPTGLRLELTGSASCCACTNPPDCSCTFTNGDFEQFVPVNGTGGGWTSSGLFAGAGWQSSGGNPGGTFLLNNVGDPNTDPTISQTICCLKPGQCYTIRGQRKVQAWFGQTAPSFAVLLDGATILALPVPSNPADANWYDFAVSFTATNACQTIGFAAEINGTDVSYWIDNIRLECCQTNSCIVCPQLNQTVVGCPPLMPNFTTNSFAGPGCTPVGPLTVTQSIPPGTPLTPGTTTVVIIRVCDATGYCRDCDIIVTAVSTAGTPIINCPRDMVLLTCTNAATAYYTVTASGNVGPVVCTPPSGTVFSLGTHFVTCTATNQCGASATCSFNVTVRPQRPRWLCPWIAIGISATPLGQAQLTSIPNLGSSGQDGVSIDNIGSSGQDGVRIEIGPAQKFTFSTELDFTQPEGAQLDIALPPDPVNPDGTPLLSFRSKGANGYCLKSNTKFTDDPNATYRSIVIDTNGDLHSSVTLDAVEMDTEVLANIIHQPGVTSVVMTVTLDCITREVTLEFPHCLWSRDRHRPKGWDGCIYGNRPPGTHRGRFTLSPLTSVVSPRITTLDLRARGVSTVSFEDPAITAVGRKWGDGHVTLMKAYDDGSEQGVEFTSFGNGGGVHVNLGHSESFNMKLQKFETGDVPTQDDLLTRTIGPIRGLTNRPPPPFLDAMLLHGTSGGVECSADFSNIGAATVHVLIYNHGMLVAERTGVSGQLSQPIFTLPDWPIGLGKLGGRVSCRSGTIKVGPIRFPGGGGGGLLPADAALPGETVMGDEFRILAELPDSAPHPDYYSSFEFLASDGMDFALTGLQRTLACTPVPLAIGQTSEGLTLTWSAESFRLQGAENVTGPWYDLGVASPVSLNSTHPARFFRLVCD
jgi:hypothetical protein